MRKKRNKCGSITCQSEVGQKSVVAVTLTQKERRLVEGVASGLDAKNAALKAGYAPTTARSKAYKIIKSHRVQSFLTDALEKLSATPEMIIKPVFDALNATRIVALKGPDGEIYLETEYPDIRLQLEGFDRAVRLFGVTLTKAEAPKAPKGNLTVVIVRASDLKKAKERAERSAIEINPKKTLEFSIARKGNVPTA